MSGASVPNLPAGGSQGLCTQTVAEGAGSRCGPGLAVGGEGPRDVLGDRGAPPNSLSTWPQC